MTTRAEKVLEALYQDAVRQRIDDVYGAFVTALNARQTLTYAQESVKGLRSLTARTEAALQQGRDHASSNSIVWRISYGSPSSA